MYYEKAAFEEAEHAAKFAELLGEVVTDSTKNQKGFVPCFFFKSYIITDYLSRNICS